MSMCGYIVKVWRSIEKSGVDSNCFIQGLARRGQRSQGSKGSFFYYASDSMLWVKLCPLQIHALKS